MNIILSIYKKYAEAIYNGTKKYEFRKKIPKSTPERVYIFTTKPACGITGYFEIKTILEDEPQKLWEQTKENSGLNEKDYKEYFMGCEKAFAYKIGKTIKFLEPKKWNHGGPQLFYYLYHNEQDWLNENIKNTVCIVSSAKQPATINFLDKNIQEYKKDFQKYYPDFDKWYKKVLNESTDEPQNREIICIAKGLEPQRAKFIGFCILKKHKDEKKLCSLYINPQYRKQSFASKLINIAKQKLDTKKPVITIPKELINDFEKIIKKEKWEISIIQEKQIIYNE